MRKTLTAVLIAVLVLASLGISAGADVLRLRAEKRTPVSVREERVEFGADTLYIGNEYPAGTGSMSAYFDVREALALPPTAAVSVHPDTGDVAEITDSGDGIPRLHVKKLGERLRLVVKDGDETFERTYVTVDGFNVSAAVNLEDAAWIGNGKLPGTAVLQADVSLREISDTFDYRTEYGVYGNGHTLCCDGYRNKPYEDRHEGNLEWPCLRLNGKAPTTVRDVRFLGKRYPEDGTMNLNDLQHAGIALQYMEVKDGSVHTIENCVFENFARGVKITDTVLHVKGCLFRNFAVCGVSVHATKNLPSRLIVENTVFADPAVAAICSWCQMETADNQQSAVEFRGFTDFYCWRTPDAAAIVPPGEKYADLANAAYVSVLENEENEKHMVPYEGKRYFNVAVLVVGSNRKVRNKTAFSGLEEQGLARFDLLEMAPILKIVLNTAHMYGYRDVSRISPGDRVSDNPDIYREMREGRPPRSAGEGL